MSNMKHVQKASSFFHINGNTFEYIKKKCGRKFIFSTNKQLCKWGKSAIYGIYYT